MPAPSDLLSAELFFLRLYANGADPRSPGMEDGAWTLPLPAVSALLRKLDGRVAPTFAVIDGHEPASDDGSARRLIAALRFYGWNPVLVVRKNFPSKEKALGFFEAGLYSIHLDLDEEVLERTGLEPIRRFYREAAEGAFATTASYRLPRGAAAPAPFLRRLFALEEFSRLSRNLIVLPDADGGDAAEGPFEECIVGHRGTMSFGREPGAFLPCRLLEEGWQAALEENVSRLRALRYAAV